MALFRQPASRQKIDSTTRAKKEAVVLDQMSAHDDRFVVRHLEGIVYEIQALLHVSCDTVDADPFDDSIDLIASSRTF